MESVSINEQFDNTLSQLSAQTINELYLAIMCCMLAVGVALMALAYGLLSAVS